MVDLALLIILRGLHGFCDSFLGGERRDDSSFGSTLEVTLTLFEAAVGSTTDLVLASVRLTFTLLGSCAWKVGTWLSVDCKCSVCNLDGPFRFVGGGILFNGQTMQLLNEKVNAEINNGPCVHFSGVQSSPGESSFLRHPVRARAIIIRP